MLRKQALEGIKVVDFTWVITGPLITKFLGDHGATVVKVEGPHAPDSTRAGGPYRDGRAGINRSGNFAFMNSSKLSLCLDLNHAQSREITRKLVAWADIVVESFNTGTVKRWGLGYEDSRQIRPDIIMLSTNSLGQTGPYARQPGYGFLINALAGFVHFTGWPDREAVGPSIPYTDTVVPWFGIAALLAALDHRRRTGQGQYIDISQYEAGLAFMRLPLLEYLVQGRVGQRLGNASPCAAPHGVYRCLGEDRWCAIAVFTAGQWEGLIRALGNPGWAGQERFATFQGRKEHAEELDRRLEEWTSQHTAEQATALLQAQGVPAGVAQDSRDLLERDPQLKHRGHFPMVHHPEIGDHHQEAWPAILTRTPPQLGPAPCLGQHNEYVCTKLLGMTDGEFVEMVNLGVLG